METNVKDKIERIYDLRVITGDRYAISDFTDWAASMGCPTQITDKIEDICAKAMKPLRQELNSRMSELNAMGYDEEAVEREITNLLRIERL
jgi:hypothetical protein